MIKVLSYQQILTYIQDSFMIPGPERQSKSLYNSYDGLETLTAPPSPSF